MPSAVFYALIFSFCTIVPSLTSKPRIGLNGIPQSLFNKNKGLERITQLLPGIRIKAQNMHSTYGRVK